MLVTMIPNIVEVAKNLDERLDELVIRGRTETILTLGAAMPNP